MNVVCPVCGTYWTVSAPHWLGPPWTEEQVDALLARHNELRHGRS
jgi:hypothetical protein